MSTFISIITTFKDEARFLEEAVRSAFAQTHPDWELILVDDGSSDASPEIARRLAEEKAGRVQLIRHPNGQNRGISASRNAGLRVARGEVIALLDADDSWLPTKLAEHVRIFDSHPEVEAVLGPSLYWHSWTDRPEDQGRDFVREFFAPVGTPHPAGSLLSAFLPKDNPVPCPSSLTLRAEFARKLGGFDEAVPNLGEDQFFLFKMCVEGTLYLHPRCLDRYRQRSDSYYRSATRGQRLSAARQHFLRWALRYLDERPQPLPHVTELLERELRRETGLVSRPQFSRMASSLRSRSKAVLWSVLPRPTLRWIDSRRQTPLRPPLGSLRLGDLRRTAPISRQWGSDRGLPVDRFYIEDFLRRNASDVRGRVLEVGDDTYTRRFGGARVTESEVLNVAEGNPKTSYLADLADAPQVPSESFDCVICTQTLQLIFDAPAAVATLKRILKPGGVLLATFPGISHMGHDGWEQTWQWNFTPNSARLLFKSAFAEAGLEVKAYGNVLTATAFLYGLAAAELAPRELEVNDPIYPMVVTVRATRQATQPASSRADPEPVENAAAATLVVPS